MPTFSFTLVQKIEAHSEQIADQVVDAIVRDPGLREMRALHRDELSRRARDLLGNLGHWLLARDQEVAKWSEPLGRTRFEQSIPLCELIRGVQIVKGKLIDFARAGIAGTALQIYAEGELTTRPKATKQRCAIRLGIAAECFEPLRPVHWIRRLGLGRSEVAWNT